MQSEVICATCGSGTTPRKVTTVSLLVELILWYRVVLTIFVGSVSFFAIDAVMQGHSAQAAEVTDTDARDLEILTNEYMQLGIGPDKARADAASDLQIVAAAQAAAKGTTAPVNKSLPKPSPVCLGPNVDAFTGPQCDPIAARALEAIRQSIKTPCAYGAKDVPECKPYPCDFIVSVWQDTYSMMERITCSIPWPNGHKGPGFNVVEYMHHGPYVMEIPDPVTWQRWLNQVRAAGQ